MYRFFFCFVLNVSKEFFFLVFFASLNLFCLSDTLTIFSCCLCVLLLGNRTCSCFCFQISTKTLTQVLAANFVKMTNHVPRCKLSCFLCYCETTQHKYKRGGADVTTSWGIFSLFIPCSHFRSVFHSFSSLILFFNSVFLNILKLKITLLKAKVHLWL